MFNKIGNITIKKQGSVKFIALLPDYVNILHNWTLKLIIYIKY